MYLQQQHTISWMAYTSNGDTGARYTAQVINLKRGLGWHKTPIQVYLITHNSSRQFHAHAVQCVGLLHAGHVADSQMPSIVGQDSQGLG